MRRYINDKISEERPAAGFPFIHGPVKAAQCAIRQTPPPAPALARK